VTDNLAWRSVVSFLLLKPARALVERWQSVVVVAVLKKLHTMTSRRNWFSPALKGDAVGSGGDSDDESLNRRGDSQQADDDLASFIPPTATRTANPIQRNELVPEQNDLAERGLPEYKDQMRAVQAGPFAGATAPNKQKPRGDGYDNDASLALPVATPFVSAIPYQPDDLADRVQQLERELAAATRPNNKRARHDERSGAAATTPLITRSVLVIILVVVIVTAGVAAGTAIALTNRKSPDNTVGGGDDEDPSIRPSVESPSTRQPSATLIMRVTTPPSRPPTKSPTKSPTIVSQVLPWLSKNADSRFSSSNKPSSQIGSRPGDSCVYRPGFYCQLAERRTPYGQCRDLGHDLVDIRVQHHHTRYVGTIFVQRRNRPAVAPSWIQCGDRLQ
jgi:hypothetical protein